MTQQINLFNPALIKQKHIVTQNNIAIVFGILLTGMLAYFYYENQGLATLSTERDALAKALENVKSVHDELVKTKTANNQSDILDLQIKELTERKAMQEEVIATVNQTKNGNGNSYAALMRAFAKQSIDGLWITGLSIDQNAQHLSISGRTLNADLVPTFISRLRSEPVLQGKTFTDLTMQSHVQTMEQTTSKMVTANQSSVEINENVARESPSGPKFIEFTLKSIPSEQATAMNKTIDSAQQLSVVE